MKSGYSRHTKLGWLKVESKDMWDGMSIIARNWKSLRGMITNTYRNKLISDPWLNQLESEKSLLYVNHFDRSYLLTK